MSGGRIALIVVGSIVALIGLAITVGGATLLWADLALRDDDGYFNTRDERFSTPLRAIVSENLDIGDIPGDSGQWADLRVRAERPDGAAGVRGRRAAGRRDPLPRGRPPHDRHRHRHRPLPRHLLAPPGAAGAAAAGAPAVLGRPGVRARPADADLGRGRRRLAGRRDERGRLGAGARRRLPGGEDLLGPLGRHRRAGARRLAAGRRHRDGRDRRPRPAAAPARGGARRAPRPSPRCRPRPGRRHPTGRGATRWTSPASSTRA